MELVPTQEEVLALLRETGALQNGHFECLNGLHTDINLETALAMRYHRNAKTLSVGLSRKLRANSELRALIPELSIVSALLFLCSTDGCRSEKVAAKLPGTPNSDRVAIRIGDLQTKVGVVFV